MNNSTVLQGWGTASHHSGVVQTSQQLQCVRPVTPNVCELSVPVGGHVAVQNSLLFLPELMNNSCVVL